LGVDLEIRKSRVKKKFVYHNKMLEDSGWYGELVFITNTDRKVCGKWWDVGLRCTLKADFVAA
jgi:hypothetical protein